MRMSDWSSDVCSSDLPEQVRARPPAAAEFQPGAFRFGIAREQHVALDHRHCDVAVRRAAEKLCDHRWREQSIIGGGDEQGIVARRQSSGERAADPLRSEEHTSELQSIMRNPYAVFCLKTQKK